MSGDSMLRPNHLSWAEENHNETKIKNENLRSLKMREERRERGTEETTARAMVGCSPSKL